MTHDAPAHPEELEHIIGYRFRNRELLYCALVHTSFVNERGDPALSSNERLEFLGDAVLSLVAAHRLFEARPESTEGDLTVSRAWLVRQSTLARWAAKIDLGRFLVLGRGEQRSGGRDRPTLLARGLEALLGALYLDGGLPTAAGVLEPFLASELATNSNPRSVVDAKSRLQQVCQAQFETTPSYTLVENTGPGHDQWFVVEVHAGPNVVARGTGHSKRAAEQLAAHTALQQLDATEIYEVPSDPAAELFERVQERE